MQGELGQLLNTLPQIGEVKWIGVRPARGEPLLTPEVVEARLGQGLVGDRYAGSRGKREVTLLQWEHLAVIASLTGKTELDPAYCAEISPSAALIYWRCATGNSPSAA